MPELEPETPPQMERMLTSMHILDKECNVIDNNDSRMFRPVAIMIVGKSDIYVSG